MYYISVYIIIMHTILHMYRNMHRFVLRSQSFCKFQPLRPQPQLSSSRILLLPSHLPLGSRWLTTNPPYPCNNGVLPASSLFSSTLLPLRNFSSSSSPSSTSLSPFDPKNLKKTDDSSSIIENSNVSSKGKKRRRTFVPRIAAVQLTEKARLLFKKLLDNPVRPDIIGIMLNYDQSKSGEPRMVYTFQFVTDKDVDYEQDEGVSLELVPSSKVDPSTGEPILIPKPPVESRNDGLPKLYIHHHAFLKVLGATIDVDTETIAPILYDREGNCMDPNA
jgi:hypothetical protein